MSADYYANGVERRPALSAKQEAELFSAYRKRRTTKRREVLVRQYLYWAAQVACRYCGPRFSKEEAISAANVGLMQAIEKYDPKCGRSFVFMSFLSIRRAVIDSMRTSSYLINPYPALDAAKYVCKRAGNTAQARTERDETRTRIFETVGNTSTAVDPETHSESSAAREEAEKSSMMELVLLRMGRLTQLERKIMRLRYFGNDTLFLREIGEKLGFKEEHIRYVHNRAIAKLRHELKGEL